MLLLPEGQTDEVWKPSKKQCYFVNLGALDGRFIFCSIHKVKRQYLYTSGGGKYPSFVREIAESIMNDIEYERNFVLVGKECTNEGS